MHKEVWRYETVKAVLRMDADGLARIDVTGLVTQAALDLMRRDAVVSMGLPGLRAMVVDFQRASVLMTRIEGSIPPELAAMPVAIVCSYLDEPMFLELAWRQAQNGFTRAVFTQLDDATSWALARAQGTSVWGSLG